MAWTAPRTWASGEIPTAAQLNTDLRDNLNELSKHAHGGGSGSGTAALGNLVSMTFIDAAAPSAPGGTLTRVYSSSTALFWRNAGGIFGISTAGHEHSIAIGSFNSTAGASATAGIYYGTLTTNNAFATVAVFTSTVGGTGSRALVTFATISFINSAVGNATGTVRFSNSSLGYTSTQAITFTGTMAVQVNFNRTDTNVASGSGTWVLEVGAGAGGGNVAITGYFAVNQEVRQA